jgi:hypothetical protein
MEKYLKYKKKYLDLKGGSDFSQIKGSIGNPETIDK